MRCVAVAQSFAPDKLRAADLIRNKIGEITLGDLTGQTETRQDDANSPEPRGKPWGLFATLGFALVIALGFIAAQYMIGLGFVTRAMRSNRTDLTGLESNGLYWAVATFASSPVVIGLTWLFVRLREGISAAEYLALRPVPWRQLFRWSVALLGLVVFSDLVTSLMDRSIVPDIMVQVHRTSHYVPLLWLALIIAAPLAEEVLFRGFVFAGVANSPLGVAGAVVVSSLAWAAIHLQYDVYGIGTVFVIGLFLGCVRHRTRSLYPCLALHALMNLIAAVQTLLLVKFIGPGA